jgi:hypothetical protein
MIDIYDNDETGKEYALRRIKEGHSVFLWRKYLYDNNLLKNENHLKDLTDLLVFIKKNNKKCTKFIDYFSNDKYDIVWI